MTYGGKYLAKKGLGSQSRRKLVMLSLVLVGHFECFVAAQNRMAIGQERGSGGNVGKQGAYWSVFRQFKRMYSVCVNAHVSSPRQAVEQINIKRDRK